MIDPIKLKDLIDRLETDALGSAAPYDKGIIKVCQSLKAAMEAGKLSPDPVPAPEFEVGDRVTHIEYPEFGEGEVKAIAKSGKRAKVEFPDYDRKKCNWRPKRYYTFGKLRIRE
ncbi:hypothetical protein [Paenibacillus gansuensis]|uniref:Uncharacterized protein n=1 Tax=Paenibacillus gansuensis TaxID=306542 RepID=A0ABW5PJV5_9BACL